MMGTTLDKDMSKLPERREQNLLMRKRKKSALLSEAAKRSAKTPKPDPLMSWFKKRTLAERVAIHAAWGQFQSNKQNNAKPQSSPPDGQPDPRS